MRERAKKIGGKLNLQTVTGDGTEVSVEVPLSDKPAEKHNGDGHSGRA
jgi:nitrate/nitrite-specific signal transduction histidine kinase